MAGRAVDDRRSIDFASTALAAVDNERKDCEPYTTQVVGQNSSLLHYLLPSMHKRFFSKRQAKQKPAVAAETSHNNTDGYRVSFSTYVKSVINLGPTESSEVLSEEEETIVKSFHSLLAERGLDILEESLLRGILRSDYANNDPVKATELLSILADSIEGTIYDFLPNTKLQGAVNREGVSCYIDSLLFAMFLRFDCFQAILYNSFPDDTRNHLVILLRLWDFIAAAGWPDAAQLQQQDASELFTFLTGKLELPLLTLKVDLYHTGCDDANDDHKFVNERLLEIPIPPDREEGGGITLEECLEAYFNNHVEVKRYLERQNSSLRKDSVSKKMAVAHVECVDCSSGSYSPELSQAQSSISGTSTSEIPTLVSRLTSSSIIQKRWVSDADDQSIHQGSNHPSPNPTHRRGELRHEVMMPALQVFSLIPWYADNLSSDDAQTAIHFSQKRPILGMCLKRYNIQNGRPVRRNTYVDIPVEIGLPHFIKDDQIDESAPIFGNFKLVLQAVVCHRGSSTDSGHYISMVRSKNPETSSPTSSSPQDEIETTWLRFDDLAYERVTAVDIDKALREESPYLLFYQILPIDRPPDHDFDERPPDYAGHAFTFNEKMRIDTEGLQEPSLDEPRNSFSSETYEISHRKSEMNLYIQNMQRPRSRGTVDGSQERIERPPHQSAIPVSISRPHSHNRAGSSSETEPRASNSFFRFSRSGQRQSSSNIVDHMGSQSLAPPKSKRHRFSNDNQENTDSRGRSNHRRERSMHKEKEKKEKPLKKKKKPERECRLM
ncbi:hypothetical protein KEM54_006949 [Ascosphaera aggregata]|nr:hypothetical protein KEM54_006949 [Ascosphaera aggregata]